MTKKKKIPAAVRSSVWNKYIGEEFGRGNCYICGGLITQGNFACGHIIAEAKGGTITLDNLRPVCTRCNSSQGTENMDDFIRNYGLKNSDGGRSKKELQQQRQTKNTIGEIEEKWTPKEYKLMKHRRFFISYKTEWRGIENYLRGGIFAPRRSKIKAALQKLTKSMLLQIGEDFGHNCTMHEKKAQIIEHLLDKK